MTDRRKIHGISAVLLPFDAKGKPDLDAFQVHLLRTHRAGLEPAVNMDTGFGPQIGWRLRKEILRLTRESIGPSAPFVAGAMPFGEERKPMSAYAASIGAALDQGATPILFQSDLFLHADPKRVARLYRELLSPCPRALAFELGTMFAPWGRIYDEETFRRLLDISNLAGLKHSSLDRDLELARLKIRDRERPEFRIYSGNDLAIDMIAHGSDYLLGLSTFDPEAFALRDRLWEKDDERFSRVNDALQAVGTVAFRDPVPAYKDTACTYLRLTGRLKDPHPHPDCPRRPQDEEERLGPLSQAVAEATRSA